MSTIINHKVHRSMIPKKKLLFSFYQWLIAIPILVIITILVALSTIILSPLLPNSRISYYPAQMWARWCCRFCFVKVRVVGMENLQPNQSYVFALNHQSIFDIFVVYGWLPFIFKWMMKAELRNIPFIGKACEAAGHIFIDRTHPIAAKKSLEKAEYQLKNGVSVVVFPEGTRTYTGEMGKFKRGAFRIATDLSLPVVPITLRGSYERLKRNSVNINPGIIEMYIHRPIEVAPFLPNNTAELIQETFNIIESKL
jgi:1-acyl-sn-glycerol-3-phosphate acyltransferase